jgi:hypothetical protein
MVTVRTLGSDYGCERLRHVNIAPHSYGCNRPASVKPTKKLATTNNLLLYPNPATSMVTIESNDMRQVQLFDISGRLVLNRNMDNARRFQFNAGTIGKGIFLVKVTDRTGKTETRKLVVQ